MCSSPKFKFLSLYNSANKWNSEDVNSASEYGADSNDDGGDLFNVKCNVDSCLCLCLMS